MGLLSRPHATERKRFCSIFLFYTQMYKPHRLRIWNLLKLPWQSLSRKTNIFISYDYGIAFMSSVTILSFSFSLLQVKPQYVSNSDNVITSASCCYVCLFSLKKNLLPTSKPVLSSSVLRCSLPVGFPILLGCHRGLLYLKARDNVWVVRALELACYTNWSVRY